MNPNEPPSINPNQQHSEHKHDTTIKLAVITGIFTVITTIITAVVAPMVLKSMENSSNTTQNQVNTTNTAPQDSAIQSPSTASTPQATVTENSSKSPELDKKDAKGKKEPKKH